MEEFEIYELFRVAQWAGIPAWELAKQPAAYLEGYKAVMWIDYRVQKEMRRQAEHGKNI